MPIGAIFGAAAGLIPAIFKGISGLGQIREGNKMKPVDPGFRRNEAVIDNARILGDRYANYQMPGYSQAQNQIGASTANAFAQGSQGASSGGDVLDLATKLAFGQQQSLNQLALQNAVGKEQALSQSLNANAAAGQEYVNENAYDRDIYQQQLRQKAALQQAGNENLYGAIDQGASVAGSLLTPMRSVSSPMGQTPEQISAMNRYLAMQQAGQGLQYNNLGRTGGRIA